LATSRSLLARKPNRFIGRDVRLIRNQRDGPRAGVAGIYNRYKYDAEKRYVLDPWDAKLLALLSRQKGQALALI